MAIALFDLDHTLLNGCSTHTWNIFVGEKVLADDREHLALAHAFHDNDRSGATAFTIAEYDAFTMKIYPEYSVAELEALTETFIRARLEAMIHDQARELVADHRRRGDLAVMITATNRVLAEPISRLFAMDALICTVPEMNGERYTGRVSGLPCYRQGKLAHLDRWLTEHGHSLRGAFFYSDSQNDLPLLTKVDHPVAVDPDPVLAKQAKRCGWPILRFRKGE